MIRALNLGSAISTMAMLMAFYETTIATVFWIISISMLLILYLLIFILIEADLISKSHL